MTKETYIRAGSLLEQIERLDSLSKNIGIQYRKSDDEDLKELLSKCNEVVSVLKQIDEDRFKEL
jgi:hypothetical protein